MEIAMFIILGFLLISFLLQKKRFTTLRPMMRLTVANMALLACQVTEWIIMRQSCLGEVPHVEMLKRVTYGLDYVLYYVVAFCFFRYLSFYITELYADQGIEKRIPKVWAWCLAGWGLLISVLFVAMAFTERLLTFTETGEEMFRTDIYAVMFIAGTACVVSSTVLLIKNYKLLKGRGFVLLLAYIVLPNVLAYVDVKKSLCVSYLMMAFFVVILYLELDLRRNSLLLRQSARLATQETNLSELRTKIMLSQMQPHFLYNTLTTISGLCYLEGAEQAKEVVDKFSDYFRANLDSMSKENFVPFEKELEHTKTYLWLEQVRFGEALNVEYKIGPTEFLLPSLSIQPIAENAVKHGIRKKKGGGTVTIETAENEKEYLIIVRDDGAGFDPAEKKDDGRSHVGIENITERLSILGAGYLEIESEKGIGTTATVHLLKERKQ